MRRIAQHDSLGFASIEVKSLSGRGIMIVKLSAMLLVFLCHVSIVGAQERIRIAWAGASPANAAIWVLQEKKLLQKYGVEPEIVSISASPIVLQALLAGEIDVSAISVTTWSVRASPALTP